MARRKNIRYLRDLIELSGGLPNKSFADKFAFYTILFMNGIDYDREIAHKKAQDQRRLKAKVLQEMIAYEL